MITIIAEKPSVAREIARIKGATERHDGYLADKNKDICVTWAFGHLIQLAMPEEYGFEKYKADSLPFVPQPFQLVRRQIKTDKGYQVDEGVAKQLEIIRQLFNDSEKIINATDAGREGELIFRYIYEHLSCHTPFVRLWVNSLTDKALEEGLNNLKPGTEYNNLYLAAKSRSEADWLVGINASQALSIAAGKGSYSLGRVQTPTLSMICNRFLENKNFKPSPFWQIKISAEKYGVDFISLSGKYTDKAPATEDLNKIKSTLQLTVTDTEKKEVKQTPPLLFDLTALQKEANIKFDFSADKTLSIAQQLYEAKLISYPRTGSNYISEDVFTELPRLIENLEQYPTFSNYAKSLKGKHLNRKSVNDAKVTDHHALIITETHIPPILAEDQARIFNLVAGRMLEAVSDNCIKEATSVKLECAGISFQVTGNIIKEKGWRAVFNAAEKNEEEENENENNILPVMEKGEIIPLKNAGIVEKQTKPKPLFTEATLLGEMETAGKALTNEDEREAMKDCGLGTPATRAGIIETLFHRDYIRKEKKSLIPSDKGLAVHKVICEMKIADVQMTGEWEKILADIEHGKADAARFQTEIVGLTQQITKELLAANVEILNNSPQCLCPKCKKSKLRFFNKVVKCPDEQCGLVIFKTKGDKQLSDKLIAELVEKGKTPLIKGFKNKDKKSFDASLVLDENYKPQYQFPPKKKKE